MSENIYEKINKALSWKRIIAFNALLFMVLVVPLSVRLAKEETENRTNAANEDVVATTPTPPPSYPMESPLVERVNAFYGKTGDTIVIIGKNFGAYKWGSKVYVGNIEAGEQEIVRWSDSILEVSIPSGARTGKVWVSINNKRAEWEGSLLLYDVSRSAKIGLNTLSPGNTALSLEKGDGVVRGIVEIAYVAEPMTITPAVNIIIESQESSIDILGKKMKIGFVVTGSLPRGTTQLMVIEHPQIGSLEIVRTELYDASGQIIEVFSDPLSVKTVQ